MFSIFDSNKKNKENFQYQSAKQTDDDDDDAESTHSDCFIIEPESSTSAQSRSKLDNINSNCVGMGILPYGTNLYLIYDSQIMNVRLVETVFDLEHEQRLTIAHQTSFYSIPKRHLYFSKISPNYLSPRNRIAYLCSRRSTYSLGFLAEIPSNKNHSRYLILFDDGTACYTQLIDQISLCLCQDFQQNSRLIETNSIRHDYQEILCSNSFENKKHFSLYQYIQVKKFDDNYHNAQIIEIDCSLLKVKFYERQAQTEIWIYQQSTLINDKCFQPIEIASPMLFIKRTNHQPDIFTDHYLPKSDYYHSHQCSSNCVRLAEEYFDSAIITQNPYALPISCGWTYFEIERSAKGRFKKKPTTHKTHSSRSIYLYRSPCGRSFLTLNEIEDYLLQTNSKLTIKYFIDDRLTRLEPLIKFNSTYILQEDITQGKESVRISVYNEMNSDLPNRFLYGIEIRSNLEFLYDKTAMTCCSCTDNCRNRMKCSCWLKTFQLAKLNNNEQIVHWQRQNFNDEQMIERFGYVHQRLKTPIWSGIYECNSQCSCHLNQCTNRLVQNSLFQQLQLFYTEKKGWGLRVLHDIPHGSFINAYVGELITEEVAIKRDFKYLAMLDHKSHLNTTGKKKSKTIFSQHFQLINQDQKRIPVKRCVRLSTDSLTDDEDETITNDDGCFILDAKHYGSISRFYNHSCKPNVHTQNVFINSHDPCFPVIALFTCRNIRAGEELCWDYNYIVGCMSDVHIECQCQASNCRGRLL